MAAKQKYFLKNTNNDLLLILKAARKECREQEIALYGKSICHSNIYKNKKKYTRKNKHKNNIL